jgi:ATP dependent DNA ligase domain
LWRLHRLLASGYFAPTVPRRILPAGFVEPCIPTLAAKPPSGPDWVHEIKHDGYRLIVRRDGKVVQLFTRRGHDWTDRYPGIAATAAKLRRRICPATRTSIVRTYCVHKVGHSTRSPFCLAQPRARSAVLRVNPDDAGFDPNRSPRRAHSRIGNM